VYVEQEALQPLHDLWLFSTERRLRFND
jgi:hypothetical protein